MKNPNVAIIIGTLNQEEKLKRCLESLKKTDYRSYKIFFVDDSGRGKIGKMVKNDYPEIKVRINKKNLGFSRFNNIGVRLARKEFNPDYFLLLNDDTEIVDEKWLEKMVLAGEMEKKIGIIGCKVVFPSDKIQWPKDPKSITDVIGACFLIKKEVIDRIGLLDEKFSPVYGEESDFCFRASKAGFKLAYVESTKIIHYGESSTKTIFNDRIWYLKKRNAIRLEWLNYGIFNILIHTLIHIGSSIIARNLFKRTILLAKAYIKNIKNLKEIKEKRIERNSWRKINKNH